MLRGYDHNINYVMNSKLQRLLYRRARVKYRLDLEIEYIIPLLAAGPKKADCLAFKINNSIKEVESHMKDFKLV